MFEDNPRVEIIVSPLPYYAYQHGEVMLGFHHGHKKNVKGMPDTFAGQFREMYGKTKQTYLHCGHLHNRHLEEFSSAIVERHSTVSSRDAHASHGGWNSQRSMQAITYHKERLECGRVMEVV